MTRIQHEFVASLERIFDLPHEERDAVLGRLVSEYRRHLGDCWDEMPPSILYRFDGTHNGMTYDDFIWSVTYNHVRIPPRR